MLSAMHQGIPPCQKIAINSPAAQSIKLAHGLMGACRTIKIQLTISVFIIQFSGMKKWMKIVSGLAVIGILAAIYIWVYVINKPHRDYEKAEPDHILAAEQLFEQYRCDKGMADSLYTGMVLQINGNIDKVESGDSMVVAIFIFDQGMFGDEGVRCILLPDHYTGLKNYGKGSEIIIKGYCTGYNDTDVILEHASIIKSK